MSWAGQKVLVTGGAGFIGSHLCDALVAAEAQVVAVDDLSVGTRDNLKQAEALGLKFVHGTIMEPEAWSDRLAEVTHVFHLAVACLRRSFHQPMVVHEINATGTLAVLEACRRHAPHLQRFLYCSSSEIYGSALHTPMDEQHPLRPTTVYGASKLAGEVYTLAAELPVTVARPFNTYGPREHHQGASGEVIPRFVVRIANGLAPIIFGDGSQTRDFTHVSDTARGLMLAAERPEGRGQIVNLARGREVSIARIAELLLQKMGRADLQPEFRRARPSDVDRHFAATGKARELLGFEAELDIEAGLDRYLQWFHEAYPQASGLLEEVQDQNW
ncbi:MAG: GDP-mannose 4,6-dehydratase [Candidatus Eremiobacteraeota bacterium]|nr:GDP-mannose 4,6-dehydratase [Candidatus Eremiobacteraeota bacterium]MCW5869961.1 GDP-mannose 4,6-dehydratase [Candidatus Eremiobacteraeota bacterium]